MTDIKCPIKFNFTQIFIILLMSSYTKDGDEFMDIIKNDDFYTAWNKFAEKLLNTSWNGEALELHKTMVENKDFVKQLFESIKETYNRCSKQKG